MNFYTNEMLMNMESELCIQFIFYMNELKKNQNFYKIIFLIYSNYKVNGKYQPKL